MKKSASGSLMLGAVMLLSGCVSTVTDGSGDSGTRSATEESVLMDPRHGWVEVFDDGTQPGTPIVSKRCDGGTLLYHHYLNFSGPGGLTAVADSPECVD